MQNIYEAISANKRRSTVIIILFTVFISAAIYFIASAFAVYSGYQPGGLGMVGIALIVSGLMSWTGYYFSDRIVLGISGARPASRTRDFDFYTVSENLSLAAAIPKPKLYIIEDSAPNAFATGRDPDHAVICATSGLLVKLNRTELEGVIAHEITHIKNYDTRLMSIVAVLVGTVALLGDWFLRTRWYGGRGRDSEQSSAGGIIVVVGILFAILSPLIAKLIQLAISRRREYLGDTGSVQITRQPGGLISALKKIAADSEPLEAANKATAHLFIVNPFKSQTNSAVSRFANLFNTHPPLADRIKALEKMA